MRVYRPAAPAGLDLRPLVLNIHGGGFVFGDLRLCDWLCSHVALRVGAVVVSVDYRLAPRHRFPAAVEDSYAALVWAAEHAAGLGAGGPVGVMGRAPAATSPRCCACWPGTAAARCAQPPGAALPATDMTAAHPATARTPFLSGPEMGAYRRHYLADADPSDPMVSPLLASDHHGLPPALIQVAEHDPLRADGIRYAAALRAAGVPVRLTEYVGMPHGYLNFPGLCRIAPQALAEDMRRADRGAGPVQPGIGGVIGRRPPRPCAQ